jgi:putative ABC transport system permease protein
VVIAGLARRFATRRFASLIATFLAVALGALVIAVCGGLLETGIRADLPAQRVHTAPIVVSGPQHYIDEPLAERARVPDSAVLRTAAVRGVDRVVRDVSFPVVTVDANGRATGDGTLIGRAWSGAQLTPYTLMSGHSPTRYGEAVVTTAVAQRWQLHVGSRTTLVAGGHTIRVQVVGMTNTPAAERDSSVARTVFLSDMEATNVSAAGRNADLLGVYPSGDTAAVANRIRDAEPGLAVHTGADRGIAEQPAAAGQSSDLIPLAGASGGLMTGTSIFIVASTLALAMQLRRRQIALLRAVGASPGQLRRLVLSETLLLAIPAGVLGVLGSRLLGRITLSQFASHGLVSHQLVYREGWLPMLVGAAGAVLIGVIAALVAAHGVLRVRPVEALAADAAPERLGWIRGFFGVLALAGAVALMIVTVLVFDGPIAASTAEPSALLWALAIGLLAPVLIRPILAGCGWAVGLVAPRSGRLADQIARGRIRQTATLCVPLMLVVGLLTGLSYLQTAQTHAVEQQYAKHLTADEVVSSAYGGLPLALVDQAARIPGVRAAGAVVTSEGFFDKAPGTHPEEADAIPMEGVTGSSASVLMNYPVLAGRLNALAGNAVAIPKSELGHGRQLGDVIRIRFGDNETARLRIVAVIRTPRGYPTVLLPAELLAKHVTTGLANQLMVRTTPGADRQLVRDRLTSLAPAMKVSDRGAALQTFAQSQQTGAWVGYLFTGAVVIYSAISLISATIAATRQRREQLRTVRLVGASRRQLLRVVSFEGLLVSAVGAFLGTGLALATVLPFDSALGTPGLPAGPRLLYPATIIAATLITVVTARASAAFVDTRPAAGQT